MIFFFSRWDRGVRIWRDGDNLPLGQSWQKEVQEVIPTGPAAAAVIGPSGIGDWHGREIEACDTQNVKRKMPLIPILLHGAPDPERLPVFLSELTWSDLRQGSDSLAELRSELARLASPAFLDLPVRPTQAEDEIFGSVLRLERRRREWEKFSPPSQAAMFSSPPA